MALFTFLTQTGSIAAEYFYESLLKDGRHRLIIVTSMEDVQKLRPDFVMMTIYDHYEEYLLTKAWSEEIKKTLPSTKLIMGGPAFRSRPVAFFNKLKADYALRGEADFTFLALVNEITGKKPDPERLKQIPGIMFLEDGYIFINGEYPRLSRSQLETMDFKHYCDYGYDMVSVFTDRGCPYGCTFCSRVFGKAIRPLSVDRIIQILKEISQNQRIKRVMFASDNMTYNQRRTEKLFGRIIREKLNERFDFLLNARIDNFISGDRDRLSRGIDFHLIDLLKRSGVVKISFGTESFNDAEIKRLKPEARYSGIDAMRLTRELGKDGIAVVHFLMGPSPDALPEEAIESTYRRLVVMEAYADYIEVSRLFANPVKIYLIRGSTLYTRALANDFKAVEFDDPDTKRVNIQLIEQIERQVLPRTDQNTYLPFLVSANRFGTSSSPYHNLLLLEEELEKLQNKQQRSKKEQQRFEMLGRKIRICRKQVNKINGTIRKINEETKIKLKKMLVEFGGAGKFLQEFSQLPVHEKREKLFELTKQFEKASDLSPINVFEAETLQMFYMYFANAVKELISSPDKTKQVIKKYKRLTQNKTINNMIRSRKNSSLHIYTKFLEKDLPTNRFSAGILKKYMQNAG